MTSKENAVRQAELTVKRQESKVREARIALEQGYRKLQADLEREYAKLKGDLEREEIELEKEKAWLDEAKTKLEQPFHE